jgi:hypothetical protein
VAVGKTDDAVVGCGVCHTAVGRQTVAEPLNSDEIAIVALTAPVVRYTGAVNIAKLAIPVGVGSVEGNALHASVVLAI